MNAMWHDDWEASWQKALALKDVRSLIDLAIYRWGIDSVPEALKAIREAGPAGTCRRDSATGP